MTVRSRFGDSVITLSRFRADTARALTRRGRKLLEATDMAGEMEALPPLEAYFIVKELGLDEALPLLRHCTAEQWQACIDLDCWDGDTFLPAELDVWLTPFADAGPEALVQAFLELDHEVAVLFIADLVEVFDVRSDSNYEAPDSVPSMPTPDGFFVLHARPHRDRELEAFVLINALYRQEPDEARRLLMAAKWEIAASMEEEAFRFRSGRVEDLGFPPPDLAARLFATPPATPPATVEPIVTRQLPALYAGALHHDSLFTAALARISDSGLLERLESEWVYLVNAAVVAYGSSPRDIGHAAAIAERVRDSLSLGLEAQRLAGVDADADAAAAVLAKWPLLHVFQFGYQQVLPLQRRAQALAADPVVAAWLAITLPPDDDPEATDRAFLRGLASRRPLWSGYDTLRPTEVRAFAHRAEVEQATRRLEELATRLL